MLYIWRLRRYWTHSKSHITLTITHMERGDTAEYLLYLCTAWLYVFMYNINNISVKKVRQSNVNQSKNNESKYNTFVLWNYANIEYSHSVYNEYMNTINYKVLNLSNTVHNILCVYRTLCRLSQITVLDGSFTVGWNFIIILAAYCALTGGNTMSDSACKIWKEARGKAYMIAGRSQ